MTAPIPDLAATEAALVAAMRASDVAALDVLIADELAFTGPDGVTLGKQDDLDAHRTGATRFLALDVLTTEIAPSGTEGSTATVADIRLDGAGGPPIEARVRWERTWRIIDGRWQVITASATVVAS